MHAHDIESSEPARTPCTAVRVTPLGDTGTPDHEWALTYRFEVPVTLLYVHRRSLPPITAEAAMPVSVPRPLPALVAFTAPYDHPQRHDVAALAQGLWQRRRSAAAVDTWTRLEDGTWAYSLIPHWQHLDTADWQFTDEPNVRTYAAGTAHPSTTVYRRPVDQSGAGDACDTGTRLYLSIEGTPPPPQGFPALLTTTTGDNL